MPQAAEWKAKVEAYRETLTVAQPDILVMVGADAFSTSSSRTTTRPS